MPVDDPQTFAILGAAMAVHTELGSRFLEVIYQRAMTIELTERGLPFELEPRIEVVYRGHVLGTYQPDFVCFEEIIVEIKARPSLDSLSYAQTLHYLAARPTTRALLLNFGAPRLEWKRFLGAAKVSSPAAGAADFEKARDREGGKDDHG